MLVNPPDRAPDDPLSCVTVRTDADGQYVAYLPPGFTVTASVRQWPDGYLMPDYKRGQLPTPDVRLTADVSRLPGAKVVGMTAQFVSERGELVTLMPADEPAEVPVGRYRVESLSLRLEDAAGCTWDYHFAGNDRLTTTGERGRSAVPDLTAGLTAKVGIGPGPVGPGREVEITPEVVTAAGLTLTDCKVYEKFGSYGRGAEAVIRLSAPGSATAAEARCGFF